MQIVNKIIFVVTGFIIFTAFNSEERNFKSDLPASIKILKTWNLPAILKEISGISFIDNDRIACIQDEMGSVFIYNLSTSSLEDQVSFAAPGDFEGIAMVNKTAWVLRSDGKLFEISSLNSKAGSAKEYSTPLTALQNAEGLCYDKNHNRLLLSIKNSEPGGKNYKGIYSFDLATRLMTAQPVFKIKMQQELMTGKRKKIMEIMPSDITIHPTTGDVYITDGRNALLLVLDHEGNFKNLSPLNNKEFQQPEGITFSSSGEMYISNEGHKNGGNILKVETVN